jgi:hypothetical protein
MNPKSFVLLAVLAIGPVHSSIAQAAESPQKPEDTPIPYASVDEALAALRGKKGVTFRTQDGWMVADDKEALTVWLITPPGHPAYPSMVRRKIVNGPGGAYFDTSVRCFASQEVCDKFFGGK